MPRWLKDLLCLFVLLALLWAGGLAWFIAKIPSGEPAQPVGQADAIVVLTGGGLRLERGFELLAEGHAPRMFVSGVEDGVTLASLLHKKEYQPFADRISPSSVELGHQARTTIGNAIETAIWVKQAQVKSILLVTGSYHMPRSLFELELAMPDVAITPVAVFPQHFAHNGWWWHPPSIRLVLSEYHKYLTSLIVSRAGA